MNATLRDNIEWVGYVDWTIRDFHGYNTLRGSTYNAYLVRDDKTAIIDTVKAPFADVQIAAVAELTDLDAVDYIVCNHSEPDHAGGLPAVVAACARAEVVCNKKCREALSLHFDVEGWRFRIVDNGESLSLGSRSLTFVNTPMAHWPESMVTYVAEEKLLFSMDAFGQHYASSNRFDDQEPLEVVMEEAKTYYANILMPYGKPVAAAVEAVGGLDIDIIAPSHGVIWRKDLGTIISAYQDWSVCKPARKVVVIYDTMWNSTEKMARAIYEGAKRDGVEVKLRCVRSSSMTTLATDVLDAAAIAVGSPTLNRTMMPQIGGLLTYLKGLRPVGKVGAAFGSHGWSGEGVRHVESALDEMNVERVAESVSAKFVPRDEPLARCRAMGEQLADWVVANVQPTSEAPAAASDDIDPSALFTLGYGMYVVGSCRGDKLNGQIANAVMQVTDTPNQVAVAIGKEELSHEIISTTKVFAVATLSQDTPIDLIRRF